MYRVFFENGSIYEGGSPANSGWDKLPDKPIIKLEYKLADRIAVFEGFEGYNHIVERYSFLNKAGSGISKLIILANKGSIVFKLTYNFMKKTVTQEHCKWGEEYRNQPHPGWKLGVSNKKPKFYVK
jgi:hypothetical protein